MDALLSPRAMGRRQRAAALEARMLKFSTIYNQAALLRDAWRGSPERREQCARCLADAVMQELGRDGVDYEAVLYAVADSICCSPLGTPWEA